ncbi:condensin complex subunit 2/barren [Blakeslea trispora]|nr:condensin complex subunit 2/barren [Blakeslea trispora]
MTFIREGDSINFQKASCTLDGCVKIYTSRVDSVATETGKLLSGLADSSNDDDTSKPTSERRVRRKTQRSEATLLKDFSSIALKKFDLDFTVDPLFKKTSADFDEGGARGLLLNHLGIDQQCKIIFDASDATVECALEELDGEHTLIEQIEHPTAVEAEDEEMMDAESDEEDDDDEEENEANDMIEDEKENDTTDMVQDEEKVIENEATDMVQDEEKTTENDTTDMVQDEESEAAKATENEPPTKDTQIEIFRLKSKLPKMEALSEFHIVPFLKGYDFFSDNFTIPDLEHDSDDEQPIPEANDAFQFDDDIDDFDFGATGVGEDMDPFNETGSFENHVQQDEDEEEEVRPSDNQPKLFEHDFLSALMKNGENNMFDYFDSTLVKNWAGPEHWKLRRPPTKKSTAEHQEPNATRRKSRATEVFWLPFKEVQEEDEDVFEKSSRKPLMGKEMIMKMTEHLLPNDIQFSSKLLLQYSLKPAMPVSTT